MKLGDIDEYQTPKSVMDEPKLPQQGLLKAGAIFATDRAANSFWAYGLA